MNTIKKVSKQTLTSLTSYNELSLFCGPITVTLTDGGGEESQTPVLHKNKTTFYILSIRLISFIRCPDTGYRITSVQKSPRNGRTAPFRAFPV